MTKPEHVYCPYCNELNMNNERIISGAVYQYHCTNYKCRKWFNVFHKIADGIELSDMDQMFIDNYNISLGYV